MNIITSSIARSLLQLREMSICRCDMIIEVVEDERDVAKDEIDFPKLKLLSLYDLENLMCFYSGNCILKFPSLEELQMKNCLNMKTFSQGVLSTPKLQKVVRGRYLEEKWWKGDLNSTIQQLYQEKGNFYQKASTLFGKDIKQICRGQIPDEPEVDQVKALEIFKDESRSIPVEILETFHNLKSLKLKASSYKELFSCGNDDKCVGTFPELKFLQVLICHNLITLLPSSTSFENLISLEVQYCNGLRSLLTSSTAKSLVRLQQMTIKQCEMLTEVVANGGDVEKVVVFRKLESLSLDCLENLTSFCPGNYTFKFLSLKRLSVDNCPKMETFSGGVLSTPKLQEVVKNGLDLYGCWDYCLNTTIKQSQKMVRNYLLRKSVFFVFVDLINFTSNHRNF
ncbi:uncharacterized protein LOC116112032 [Pistacia vera]|uniref:uncharacterized protein LOC116112032 n=1 Tax=Pistacia vera TaxID=55513 RepID=UPI0012637D67|nr:uncharacterized protein LOC116112032 [Pistacia vera]